MQTTNQDTTIFSKLQHTLFTPIPKGSIVFFRVVFGLILFWDVFVFFGSGWIDIYFINPIFYFKYYGFSWVHPWSGDGMYYHFVAMGFCALCIACGFLYRFTSVLTFLLFTYMFLLDETRYLNHFYLISLLLFIMMFVPANRAFSIDALLWPKLKEKPIHRWTVWLLRFQIGCVYIFGGIAKINPDWLRGEPMRQWLGDMAHFPVIGNFLASEFTAWAFSYGGIFFDLGIVWLLLYKPTRTLGLLLACFFHLTNVILFHIGIFPWLMLFTTLLFMPADWPHRVITTCFNDQFKEVKSKSPMAQTIQISRWQQKYACWLIIIFVTLQCLIPLRHLLYPGNVNWTEEGYRFSWRMMLYNKAGNIAFDVKSDQLPTAYKVEFKNYSTRTIDNDLALHQTGIMVGQPDMIIQYAHYLVERFQKTGHTNIVIHARSELKFNDRPLQTFIDPTADLAALSRDLKHCDWVVPLKSRPK